MKLSEFKTILAQEKIFSIALPDGKFVPAHFHITEMGIINKKYTDCGNTFREENYFTFQLWYANDTDHRITSEKVLKIITGIEKYLSHDDLEIQVEYQGENTISKFGLDFANNNFVLTLTKTTCLALESCGLPNLKPKIKLNELQTQSPCNTQSQCC